MLDRERFILEKGRAHLGGEEVHVGGGRFMI